MFDPELYTISIRKEVMDNELYYVARVAELPDVIEFGDTLDEARTLALETITTAHELFLEHEMFFPAPKCFDEDLVEASGRLTLRLPKTLHAQVIGKADAENVSLNSYLISIISEANGKQYQKRKLNEDFADIINSFKTEVNNLRRELFGYKTQIDNALIYSFRRPIEEIPTEKHSKWIYLQEPTMTALQNECHLHR